MIFGREIIGFSFGGFFYFCSKNNKRVHCTCNNKNVNQICYLSNTNLIIFLSNHYQNQYLCLDQRQSLKFCFSAFCIFKMTKIVFKFCFVSLAALKAAADTKVLYVPDVIVENFGDEEHHLSTVKKGISRSEHLRAPF